MPLPRMCMTTDSATGLERSPKKNKERSESEALYLLSTEHEWQIQ